MSWSISAEGTKDAVRAAIANAKPYGALAPDEQAAFDKAKETLLWLVDVSTPSTSTGCIALLHASAAGHGVNVGALSCVTRMVLG